MIGRIVSDCELLESGSQEGFLTIHGATRGISGSVEVDHANATARRQGRGGRLPRMSLRPSRQRNDHFVNFCLVPSECPLHGRFEAAKKYWIRSAHSTEIARAYSRALGSPAKQREAGRA